MKIQAKHIAVIAILAFSAYLAYDSITEYVNPYISVKEISLNPGKYVDKSVQVIGVPDFDSLVIDDVGVVTFDIFDEGSRLTITYSGSLPQNFDQSDQVVAIGTVSSSGEFVSDQLLVKCPSKYESEEEKPPDNTLFIVTALLGVGAAAYLFVTVFWKKG